LLAQRLQLFGRTGLLRLALFLPLLVADEHTDRFLGKTDGLVTDTTQLVDVDSSNLHCVSSTFLAWRGVTPDRGTCKLWCAHCRGGVSHASTPVTSSEGRGTHAVVTERVRRP